MKKIAIISSSVRIDRASHRVALFFKNHLEENKIASVDLIDLEKYNFPIFNERLKNQKDPLPNAIEYSERIKSADGVIIVTPEYNGGYPASIKNAIDLLTVEWKRKPVAISTVSDGSFGGTQVIIALQFVLWKLGALTVPAMFPVPKVAEVFDENGKPIDPEKIKKRTNHFVEELMWCVGKGEDGA